MLSVQGRRGMVGKRCGIVTTTTSERDGIQGNVFSNSNIASYSSLFASKSQTNSHESFTSPLPFPLLDTFPTIFNTPNNDTEPPSQQQRSTPLLANLSITSATCTWLTNLERSASRHIGFEEREELSNSLLEIAEAYRAGVGDGDDDDGDW